MSLALLSWVANEEWVDTIGLDVPKASVELMARSSTANLTLTLTLTPTVTVTVVVYPSPSPNPNQAWAVCLFRVWRLQILRSFWTSAAAPAPPRNLGQSFFQGSYDAPAGTHPQEVMHGILSRVATAWQQPEWTVVSAVRLSAPLRPSLPLAACNIAAARLFELSLSLSLSLSLCVHRGAVSGARVA